MIHVRSIPGGWYLDALPSGEHACLVPHLRQVDTHAGPVPCPEGDEPLWIVTTNLPVFRFMGQAHASRRSLEWTAGGTWATLSEACGVWALIYGPRGEVHISDCAPPVGSQGWRYVAPNGRLVPGDATIAAVHGLNEWTDLSLAQDGSVLGGQGHEGEGACVWADGHLRLLHGGACFNTRWKWDPVADLVTVSFYEVAPDGLAGWIYRLSMADLCGLPLVVPPPVRFAFDHDVMVAPFRAEGSGAFDVMSLGIYTEAVDPQPELADAARRGLRLLLTHDAIDDWSLPSGLRPWDLPFLEFFRRVGETLEQSVARWYSSVQQLTAQWPYDYGVIPMCYDQFNPGTGHKWSRAEMLDGLRHLSGLVNVSSHCKVIAPFSYKRDNGIIAYPELQAALVAMRRAGADVVALMPIAPAEKKHDPPPPPPPPPRTRFALLRPYRIEGSMNSERGYLIGAQGKYLRGDGAKVGIMGAGTFLAAVDAVTPNDDCEFELEERPDGHSARHVTSGLLLEMDATAFSGALDKQYYLKSDGGKPPIGYAVLTVRQDTDGTVEVKKKYDHREDGKPTFVSAGLCWVKKAA